MVDHHRPETDADRGFGVVVISKGRPSPLSISLGALPWFRGPFDKKNGFWELKKTEKGIQCVNLSIIPSDEIPLSQIEWLTGRSFFAISGE